MRIAVLPTAAAVVLAWGATCAAEPNAGGNPAASSEFFERRVRPILATRCLECHGPDKQENGLRLDSREALAAGGESGPAVAPGDADGSLLVRAIRYDDEPQMPPTAKLSDGEIATLVEWVAAGAVWPTERPTITSPAQVAKHHWAFQPIADPPPPAVHEAAWPRTSLDPFVLAALESRGIAPSPPAERRTLIRRLYFDLVGLPPTPEEVAAFVADESPTAYEALVERLLASPHYGERWGRYWLDVARYADTKGYSFFEEPNLPWAWTYRDYVIESLNADLPFDRFVEEQIAADQLPGADQRRPSLRALGFLSVGSRFMNIQQDIVDDRIDAVCRGLLGLTVGCARCHDHKYDPIPSADYYSLYGVFASCFEPAVPPLYAEPPATAEYQAFARELDERLAKYNAFIDGKHAAIVQGARRKVGEYLLAAHAAGDHPRTDNFMFVIDTADLNPLMILRWQVFLDATKQTHHRVLAPWHALAALPPAEFAAQAPAVCAALAAPVDAALAVNPLVVQRVLAPPPATLDELAARYGALFKEIDERWEQLAASTAGGARPAGLPNADEEEVRQVVYARHSPPDFPLHLMGDIDLLPDRASQDELKKLRGPVEQWRSGGPGAPPRAMVMVDAPVPYEPRVFRRGNPNNLGPAVPRQFLGLLAGPERKPFVHGSGRLELAQAIVDPANPLTARVLVNRVWAWHFGQPLVATPSDFGTRSDPPTHPELLDHLATTLARGGWSLKDLHRRIVLSATYRQSSDDRPDCAAVDPENRLLWRSPRRRLDWEALRDALVSAAGRLDRTVGGPSGELFAAPFANRRTLYGRLDRLNVPGLWRTFDFPSPDSSSPGRAATTVPPQSLFLMNHPQVMELAGALAARADVAGQTAPAARIARLYELLFARQPTLAEVIAAEQFVATPTAGPDGWMLLCHALLMSNEFAWVD